MLIRAEGSVLHVRAEKGAVGLCVVGQCLKVTLPASPFRSLSIGSPWEGQALLVSRASDSRASGG